MSTPQQIIFNILLLNMPLYSNVDGRKVVYWLSNIGVRFTPFFPNTSSNANSARCRPFDPQLDQ